jgi:hypothetical protein
LKKTACVGLSEVKKKITLQSKSIVKLHAPSNLPESLWVLSLGSNGVAINNSNFSKNNFSSDLFFFIF